MTRKNWITAGVVLGGGFVLWKLFGKKVQAQSNMRVEMEVIYKNGTPVSSMESKYNLDTNYPRVFDASTSQVLAVYKFPDMDAADQALQLLGGEPYVKHARILWETQE